MTAACQAEEDALRKENDKLRKEVNDMKNKLIAAEMKNGGTHHICFL